MLQQTSLVNYSTFLFGNKLILAFLCHRPILLQEQRVGRQEIIS